MLLLLLSLLSLTLRATVIALTSHKIPPPMQRHDSQVMFYFVYHQFTTLVIYDAWHINYSNRNATFT